MVQAGSAYRFRNVKGGIYLDESNKEQGTVHGWDSRPDNDNQKWQLEDAGNGGFRIKNVGHGRYLSVSGPHDNAAVKTSGDGTVWTFKSQGRGDAIYIQDTDFVIDLDQGKDENGTRVSVWRYTGAHQQLWEPEEVGGGYRGGQQSYGQPSSQPSGQQQQYQGPIQPGTYRAHNIFTNAALDLAGGSPNDGTPIVAWSAGTGTNQTWVFESGTNGYRIKNGASGSYLGYGTLNEGELISGRGQPVEWKVTQADKGYQIHPAQNDQLVLDLASGAKEDGAKICLWSNKNGDNQKWNFAPA